MSITEFISKRKKPLIVTVLFVVATLVVAQLFLPGVLEDEIVETTSTPVVDERFDAEAVFVENAPEVDLRELSEIFSGTETTYWDEWTWQDKMTQFIVTKVNSREDHFDAYIRNPGANFSGEPVQKVFPNCPNDQTVLVDKENPLFSAQVSDFKLVGKMDEGDIVYAYCLDEECLNIGKKCILLDTSL